MHPEDPEDPEDPEGEKLPSGGVRFRFKQSVIHKKYFFWLYEFFSSRGYCSNNPPVKIMHMSPHLFDKAGAEEIKFLNFIDLVLTLSQVLFIFVPPQSGGRVSYFIIIKKKKLYPTI